MNIYRLQKLGFILSGEFEQPCMEPITKFSPMLTVPLAYAGLFPKSYLMSAVSNNVSL